LLRRWTDTIRLEAGGYTIPERNVAIEKVILIGLLNGCERVIFTSGNER
jgi:hypothetical protein